MACLGGAWRVEVAYGYAQPPSSPLRETGHRTELGKKYG